MVPAEEERLPNLATRVQIRVRLSSSLSNDTPAINFRDVNLVGYLNKTTGAYLTRENELTQEWNRPRPMCRCKSPAAPPCNGSPATTAA